MEKKLEVKNLTISFRTVSGKVQAVRDISFDLNRGETLSIVGESGSGKSVTSKAILGILAGNSIIEGGEIIYDGRDLLKITEDEFYKIRGDKIAMIFQDPLSSLNPIMRIGKQLTEAMILKGKLRQKASRKAFNGLLALLNEYMIKSCGEARSAELTKKCRDFDKFEFKHIELEKAYLIAYEAAEETVSDITDGALFLIENNGFVKDQARTVSDILKGAALSKQRYVVYEDAAALDNAIAQVKSSIAADIRNKNYANTADGLRRIRDILQRALGFTQPNFFALGFYVTFSEKEVPEMSVEELNRFMRKYLDDSFMLMFISDVEKALEYANNAFTELKIKTTSELEKSLSLFDKETLDKQEIITVAGSLIKSVKASINPLEINKDSIAYTFESSIKAAISIYFDGIIKNAAEKKRYEKQKQKYDALIASGKNPDWVVAPAAYADIELAKLNIKRVIERLLEHYQQVIAERNNHDYNAEAVSVIDYLKLNASGVVFKVTKAMAKHKALKLMDEVGIDDPRRRYKQYPFEFSGGMRQRIVIAIALAANPDILICDEPTTALDVTIQAQILELINKLKKERNLSIIFITHDLGVVANMADRIAVMYAGKIVETGTADDIFYTPAHPYTWALLSSMPDLDTNEKLESIPGTPPNMIYPPKGDAFAERNKYALEIDFEEQPPMFDISETHSAATWLLHPSAPKVEMPAIVSERIKRMQTREKKGGDING